MLDFLNTYLPYIISISAICGIVIVYFAYRNYKRNKKIDSEELPIQYSKIEILETENDYITKQVNAISDAKISIQVWLHTIHTSSSYWRAAQINDALKSALDKGIIVRVISSDNREQIEGAYQLTETMKIPVKFSNELLFSDLRYIKVDANYLILGLANKSQTDSNFSPSESWIEIKSHGINQLIDKEFERIWLDKKTNSFYQYFAKYLQEMSHIPLRDISDKTSIPQKFISSFKNRVQNINYFNDYIFIFHGKSAAGKSKLIEFISNKWAVREIDLDDVILPLIHKYGNEEVKGDLIEVMYEDLLLQCQNNDYDIIETGTDYVDLVLPRLFKIIRNKGKVPLLIYFDIGKELAIKRNDSRNRKVPISIIHNQHSYEESGRFIQLCKENDVTIINLDANNTTKSIFEELKTNIDNL